MNPCVAGTWCLGGVEMAGLIGYIEVYDLVFSVRGSGFRVGGLGIIL